MTLFKGWQRLASPAVFYQLATRLIPWLGTITVVLLLVGLYGGLVLAPLTINKVKLSALSMCMFQRLGYL